MNLERLVEMVNDIAAFFHSEPDHPAAVTGIAMHLRRFWEPRMRRQIIAHVEAGGHGLVALGREGIEELARMQKNEAA